MKECSKANPTIVAEIARVSATLHQPHGWLKVVKGEALAIYINKDDLTADVKAITAAFDEKPSADYTAAGTAIGKIVAVLLKPVTTSVVKTAAAVAPPTTVVSIHWPWSKHPTKKKEIAVDEVAEHVALFTLGVAEGLDMKTGGGEAIKKCVADSKTVFADVTNAVTAFKAAFALKSADKLAAGFEDLAAVAQDFAAIMAACKANPTIVADVTALAKQLAAPHGLIKVVKGEALTVWRNRTDLTANCKAVYNDFEEKPSADFSGAGKAVGSILAVLIKPTLTTAGTLAFVGAAPASATPHYEDPNTTGSCQSGEMDVEIQGVQGKMCSPKCSAAGACPADVPAGVTAKPTCALQGMGGKYCALVCSPSTRTSGLRAGDAQCGKNASCKAIGGVGICTYDK